MQKRWIGFILLLSVVPLIGQLSGQETRYVSIGSLQSHFTAYGSERAWNNSYYEGLIWPADYPYQDNAIIKRAWIATQGFTDITGTVHDYYGVYFTGSNVGTTLFPIALSQSAKFASSTVLVNGFPANQTIYDIIDELVPDQIPDRIITNVVNTSMGLTQTREIRVFSQEYHDNYFIKIFTFTNTGNVDEDAEIELNDSLRGVRIGWGTRYSCGREAAYTTDGSQVYGKHSWVTRRGEDYSEHVLDQITPENPIAEWLRSGFSWMGQSNSVPWDNIGAPDLVGDGRLTSPHFIGSVVLHVDVSANDPSDDISQPAFLGWHAGDTYPDQNNYAGIYNFLAGNPYPSASMGGTNRMDDALESITHRLDPYTIHGDAGGTNQMVTYGPFDLAHGESITIVEAEGANGLNREHCQLIGARWKLAYDNPADSGPFTLPDGGETSDADYYKNAWVYTGKDSVLKTFGRAKRNFDANYEIPEPPMPPPSFSVTSDTAKIILSWEPSPSEVNPNFAGYRIYRSLGSNDTPFTFIAQLVPGTSTFEDVYVEMDRLHFYYIVAFTDGSQNFNSRLNPSGSLHSSKFYTLTTEGAFPLHDTANLNATTNYTFKLNQNYPNPFNPITTIQYLIPEQGDVALTIFDVQGRCVKSLALEMVQTGQHEFSWDARDAAGQGVPTGVYYFRIQTGRRSETIKMLYLK